MGISYVSGRCLEGVRLFGTFIWSLVGQKKTFLSKCKIVKISYRSTKFPVTGRNFLSKEKNFFLRKIFSVTGSNFSVYILPFIFIVILIII